MTGLVLAGAAALGAYEVGVLDYIVERVTRDVGCAMPDVISGTSAGAINAMALAAFADRPSRATHLLVEAWQELRIDHVVRPSSLEVLSMGLDIAGVPHRIRRALRVNSLRGGVLDPVPIARLVERIPFHRIADHVASGRLRGAAVTATRVATGEAVIFHHAGEIARPWHGSPNLCAVATTITRDHVLASASIPLLFPPVQIGEEMYCDGGLRQMVPLSPALHLGADRLLVVNPVRATRPAATVARAAATSSPLYMAGKALNALFADRVASDLDRLTRTTELLRAGARRFGPTFERDLNLELERAGEPTVHATRAVSIEPSQDLGALATEYVSGREFRARSSGPTSFVLRCIADTDPSRVGDLLAYVLFDGGFTRQLIELGRVDARARHEELCSLLAQEAPEEEGRVVAGA